MPHFGTNSLNNLHTCHDYIQRVALEVIQFYDHSIICGHRNKHAQNEAFANGKSTKRWPESEHNVFPSIAVDVAPWWDEVPHIRWDRKYEFILLAGIYIGVGRSLGIELRWGGNWDMDQELITDQRFIDLPHLELVL
jgi:peptidoglycan L-alanyl-D-glutamate endopeptidase CwlK